jgi:peptide/nickel transport system substrate-binding protein
VKGEMRGLAWVLVTVMGISLGLRAQADLPFADAAPAPKRGGVLRVVDEAPGSPFGIPWEIVGVSVCAAIPAFESLLWVDRQGRISPRLAERWEVAPDRRSVTLTLRRGIRFHDGTPLDAGAVVYNLQRQMEARRVPFRSVEAVDDRRVRIHLQEWDNRIWLNLMGTSALMVSPSFLERQGLDRARWEPVGTGPFRFVRYQRDAAVTYRRFVNYWQPGKPYLDGVEMRFIRDLQTLRAAFLAGQVDVAGLGPYPAAAELIRQGYPAESFFGGVVVLVPDSANPDSPLADRRVREAIGYAIDREALAQATLFGLSQGWTQLTVPESRAYLQDHRGPTYNPARARELLAQAGYPNGFETTLIPAPYLDRNIAVALQQYLNAVGIRAQLELPEIGRYTEYQRRGWRGMLIHVFGYFPNFNAHVAFYYTQAPEGYASMRRPAQLETLFRDSVRTLREERHKVQALHRLLLSDLTVIPLMRYGRIYVMQKYVRDTKHLRWATWPFWAPEDAWLDR